MEVEEELEDDREAQEEETAANDVGETTTMDSDSESTMSEVVGVSEDEEEQGAQGQLTMTVQAKKATRNKKRAKGEIRAAIEVAKAEIKAGQRRRLAKTSESQRPKTSTKKKSKAAATGPGIPSGLLPNWKANLKTPTRSHSQGASGSGNASFQGLPVQDPIGGLNDDDASAVQPSHRLSTSGHANLDRKNDTVLICDAGDDSDDKVTVPASKRPKPRPVLAFSSKPAGSTAAEQAKPLLAKARGIHRTLSLKGNLKTSVQVVAPTGDVGSPSTSGSPGDSDTSQFLPKFARSAWVTRFLPTLYAYLGSLNKPWELSEPGSDEVQTIQMLIDIVYPQSGYKVQLNDKIYNMAKNRINDKRAYFGRQAIKVVATHFNSPEFAGNHVAIAKYASWATRHNGPGIWKVPTPVDCTYPEDSIYYIKPREIFQSPFVISVLTSFIKWCKGSCFDFGYPKGALGMAAGGVERAFLMYKTGKQEDIGNYTREKMGGMIDDYIVSAEGLSKRRWMRILESCGAQFQQDQDIHVEAPSMERKRQILHEPSSPIVSADEPGSD
ncbi:hypothetical protein BGW80DRAFT_1256435 [Lactifluus volemus]|nr:hypothetical protein BGW80DRAFT_1256435 [Lactifluus volemus]